MAYGPRSRTLDSSSEELTTVYTTNHYTGGDAGNCTPPMVSRQYFSFRERVDITAMDDVVVENFHKRVSAGEIINNPMKRVSVVANHQPFRNVHIEYYSVEPTTGCKGGDIADGEVPFFHFGTPESDDPYPTVDIDVDRLSDLAITEAFAKIDTSEMSILATAGEFQETVRSLVDIFTRVVKIYRAIRSLNFRALRNEIKPKALAARYMEFRYALRPLVYDAFNIYEAFCVMTDDFKPLRKTWRCSKKESDSATVLRPVQRAWCNLDAETHTHRTVVCRAGVLTDIEFLSDATILGLDRPVEAMWELVPFSFILDWFLNLGKLIASFTPNVGVRTLTSWVTIEDTQVNYARVLPAYGFNGAVKFQAFDFSGAFISRIITTKKRIPNPSRPIMPHFEVKLDMLKLLDLVIILKGIDFIVARMNK